MSKWQTDVSFFGVQDNLKHFKHFTYQNILKHCHGLCSGDDSGLHLLKRPSFAIIELTWHRHNWRNTSDTQIDTARERANNGTDCERIEYVRIWVSNNSNMSVIHRTVTKSRRHEPNRTEASPVSMRWRKNSRTGRTCVLVASGKDRSSTTKRTTGKVLDSSESSTPSFSWKDLDATRFGLNESEAEGELRALRAPLAALKTRLKALTAPLSSTSPLCSSRALWQRSSNSKFSWKIFGELRQCNRRLASLEP